MLHLEVYVWFDLLPSPLPFCLLCRAFLVRVHADEPVHYRPGDYVSLLPGLISRSSSRLSALFRFALVQWRGAVGSLTLPTAKLSTYPLENEKIFASLMVIQWVRGLGPLSEPES